MRGPSIERGRQTKNHTINRFTIQFTSEQSQQLRALATSRGIRVATLIREIVTRELETQREPST